jgi:hypothetical protein
MTIKLAISCTITGEIINHSHAPSHYSRGVNSSRYGDMVRVAAVENTVIQPSTLSGKKNTSLPEMQQVH